MDTLKIELYDDIGARYYNYLTDEFVDITFKGLESQIKSFDGNEIKVYINSFGGSVLEGLAIYNSILGHKAKVTTKIIGYAMSMASVIAMAGDTIEMPENSYLMIHEPWNTISGDSADMKKQAELLDSMGNQIAKIYAKKSRSLTKTAARELMRIETWLTGTEAKKIGLVDKVTKGVSIAASFKKEDFKNMPQGLIDIINSEKKNNNDMDFKAKYEALKNKTAAFFGIDSEKVEDFDFSNAFETAANSAVENAVNASELKALSDKFAEGGEYANALASASALSKTIEDQNTVIDSLKKTIESQNETINQQSETITAATNKINEETEAIKNSFSDNVAKAVADAIEKDQHNAGGSSVDKTYSNAMPGIKKVVLAGEKEDK